MPDLEDLLQATLEKLETLTDEERDAFFASQEIKAAKRAQLEDEDEWHVVGGAADILARRLGIEPGTEAGSGPINCAN